MYVNPDYPTQGGSFVNNTYTAPSNFGSDSFYYNGGGINPFGNQPMDSRRNVFSPMGYPIPQQQPQSYVSEQNLMPYSSYPPQSPQQAMNQCGYGNGQINYSSFVDSRRNNPAAAMGQTQFPTGQSTPQTTNPWSTTQQPTQPVMNNNPYVTNPYANQYNYVIEPSVAALYANPINGFEKKTNYWENQYTMPQYIQQPNINWNTSNQMSMNPYNQYGMLPQNPYGSNQNMIYQPQYNAPIFPKVNMSWEDIAKQNWGI